MGAPTALVAKAWVFQVMRHEPNGFLASNWVLDGALFCIYLGSLPVDCNLAGKDAKCKDKGLKPGGQA
jgi:hypothetical protein